MRIPLGSALFADSNAEFIAHADPARISSIYLLLCVLDPAIGSAFFADSNAESPPHADPARIISIYQLLRVRISLGSVLFANSIDELLPRAVPDIKSALLTDSIAESSERIDPAIGSTHFTYSNDESLSLVLPDRPISQTLMLNSLRVRIPLSDQSID